ncbi:MAG TPA: hypothetical protein VK151_12430 [Fluviicola sp.]|nr:hypothetical protein [Fluviicola sp.]
MKKLLLLLAFVPGIGCCVYAQETEKPTIQLQQEVPDSLAAIYEEIDQLSIFELEKRKEACIYKCRKEPSDHNRAVLAYVEKRIKESK